MGLLAGRNDHGLAETPPAIPCRAPVRTPRRSMEVLLQHDTASDFRWAFPVRQGCTPIPSPLLSPKFRREAIADRSKRRIGRASSGPRPEAVVLGENKYRLPTRFFHSFPQKVAGHETHQLLSG